MRGPSITEPLKVPPAYEVVLSWLRRAIHLGLYRPGDKLPPERTLAGELGVSRVTLREAIRVLEGEGYLVVRRGSAGGVTILDRSQSLGSIIESISDRFDEFAAIAEFRLVNEALAAARAATRVSAEDLDFLRESLDALAESTEVGDFRRADSAFHLRIAAAARSDLLTDAIEDARAALFLPFDALDSEIALPATAKSHRRILKALEKGDAAAAEREMKSHLRHSAAELDDLLATHSKKSRRSR